MPITPRLTPPLRIEILVYPRVQILDVAGPLQVFVSANELAAREGGPRPYAPVVVAQEPRVLSTSGLGLLPHALPPRRRPLDTLVIAGGFGVNNAANDRRLLGWIRARAATARRIASVCSGAFLLAEAGLLDGRRAATHWGRLDEFARRFPRVRLEPDPIFVNDGKIWTSAGITAGIDLALALVEADFGHRLALAVARQLVVFLKRPGGQAQFSTALALQAEGRRFEPLNAWIADHLRDDLSVPALARAAGMSERSFVRHYRQDTGATPARAVASLRVERARRLLEEGARVKRVARACGFGAEETMRRAFLSRVGVTPDAYRARFA